MISAVELFSGCGGLAYGLCEAGVCPSLMIEWNQPAALTLLANKRMGVRHARDWTVEQKDVREIDWSPYLGNVAVVAGGPPCQPFSQAGKHKGSFDKRDMWPEAIRAVGDLSPICFLFENVRGLMRKTFETYFCDVRTTLAQAGHYGGYHVSYSMVNTADYGAAQKRHRVIVAGVRRDAREFKALPAPTHSRERLLWDQWVTGDYWHRHSVLQPKDDAINWQDVTLVAELRRRNMAPSSLPWRTVRDAFVGLDDLTDDGNHIHKIGARSYKGHTGSVPDMPAKALKAGSHGVPGGENMIQLAEGGVRYFTIREMARLQGLPDEYTFPGSWTESTRQLGNAVPVELALALGLWINEQVIAAEGGKAA